MAEPFRFQFSLPNSKITTCLLAIPMNYRALFVEMALHAWFSEENKKDVGKLSLDAFVLDKRKEPATTRIRVTISNKTIVSGLHAISRKRRSFVAELALNIWMASKPGKVAFEMLTSRNKEEFQGFVSATADENEATERQDEFLYLDCGEASDTERLIKSALAFE